MMTILAALAKDLKTKTITDPANTNNIISNDVSQTTKQRIASLATTDQNKEYWDDIFN